MHSAVTATYHESYLQTHKKVNTNDIPQLCIDGSNIDRVFFWYSAVPTAGQWLPSLGRRQSTTKNSGHSCKTSSKQPSMGIMSRENSRCGFLLPSSRFLPSSVLLLDSSIIANSHHHTMLLTDIIIIPQMASTRFCFNNSLKCNSGDSAQFAVTLDQRYLKFVTAM